MADWGCECTCIFIYRWYHIVKWEPTSLPENYGYVKRKEDFRLIIHIQGNYAWHEKQKGQL